MTTWLFATVPVRNVKVGAGVGAAISRSATPKHLGLLFLAHARADIWASFPLF